MTPPDQSEGRSTYTRIAMIEGITKAATDARLDGWVGVAWADEGAGEIYGGEAYLDRDGEAGHSFTIHDLRGSRVPETTPVDTLERLLEMTEYTRIVVNGEFVTALTQNPGRFRLDEIKSGHLRVTTGRTGLDQALDLYQPNPETPVQVTRTEGLLPPSA